MVSQEQKLRVIITACLLTITWVLYVISNALPSWGKATISSSLSAIRTEHRYGLWEYCISGICITIPNNCYSTEGGFCSKLLATRAFIILACIIVPFAVGCFIFIVIRKSIHSSILLFSIIGTGVDISYFIRDILYFMGPAAIVCIVADILNLIAAIVACFIRAD